MGETKDGRGSTKARPQRGLPQDLQGADGLVKGLAGAISADYCGLFFEAKVATELSEFLLRYNEKRDGFWSALARGRIEVHVTIDGVHAETEGARLRYFIVSDALRGQVSIIRGNSEMAQRILVVEDEPAIADNIAYVLRIEGFEVVWCSTGEEALRVLEENGISLIVLDVGLPDLNGFELCKQIRKTSAVPIIFLTARTDEIDRVVGLEIGGDDYVPKPFSPRELAARVKAVLRRFPSADNGSGAARVDSPFIIDRQRMKIRYFGKPVDLARYEFRILEVLLRRPGWVFSRDKLMDLVWEEPEASMDRTVDAHVKTIRAKLHKIKPNIDPIQTHRGLGYSLKESW